MRQPNPLLFVAFSAIACGERAASPPPGDVASSQSCSSASATAAQKAAQYVTEDVLDGRLATYVDKSIVSDLITHKELESLLSSYVRVRRVDLAINRNGNEVCAAQGLVCLSVIDKGTSERVDINEHFVGHAVEDCLSRVVRQDHCLGNANYAVAPVRFIRSPGATGMSADYSNTTCLSSPDSVEALCLESSPAPSAPISPSPTLRHRL